MKLYSSNLFFSTIIGFEDFKAKSFRELDPTPSSDIKSSHFTLWFDKATLCNS